MKTKPKIKPTSQDTPEPIGWVPVTERMPEPNVAVLVARYGGRLIAMDALFYNGDWIKSKYKDVTHWAPLLPAPNRKA